MSAIIEHGVPLQKVIRNYCKNKIAGLKCKAFERIPVEILSGDTDLFDPLPAQGTNVVFEQNGRKS